MADKDKIRLPAEREELNKFLLFVIGFAKNNDFDNQKIWELELVADEILTNIIDYAYPKKNGTIEVICSYDNQSGLLMEIYDDGIPFNPLSLTESCFPSNIQEVNTKGFGITLIRRLVDNIAYKRKGDMNCLILGKKT